MSVITNWSNPIVVDIGSTRHIVRGAAEASWLLADKWPVVAGKPFMNALRACAAELSGDRNAQARTAFIEAAHDAKLAISAHISPGQEFAAARGSLKRGDIPAHLYSAFSEIPQEVEHARS